MNDHNSEQQLLNGGTASETGSSTEHIQKTGGWWFRSNSNSIHLNNNSQLSQKSIIEDNRQPQKVQSSPTLMSSMATISTMSKSITHNNNSFENLQFKGMSSRERRDCTIIGKSFF